MRVLYYTQDAMFRDFITTLHTAYNLNRRSIQ